MLGRHTAGVAALVVLSAIGQTTPAPSPSEPRKVVQRATQGQEWSSSDEVRHLEARTASKADPQPPKPAPKKPAYRDTIDGWIREASDILRRHDVPLGPWAHERLKRVAWHESSFRPAVVNTWDSNAAKGIPSKGLMQTIRPTFEAYKLPGHDDIMNPVDNTIAATRYMFDRYGSIEQHPGIQSLEAGGNYRPY